jgi:hypothetical protein
MNPFDFLNSINQTKISLIDEDPGCEREYNPFLANRGLSYFSDTIFLANEMNRLSGLGKKLQYDFLLVSVRARKRFSKWIKDESNDRIDALKTLYGYSHTKAKQAAELISDQDWNAIFARLDTGGTNTKIPK